MTDTLVCPSGPSTPRIALGAAAPRHDSLGAPRAARASTWSLTRRQPSNEIPYPSVANANPPTRKNDLNDGSNSATEAFNLLVRQLPLHQIKEHIKGPKQLLFFPRIRLKGKYPIPSRLRPVVRCAATWDGSAQPRKRGKPGHET